MQGVVVKMTFSTRHTGVNVNWTSTSRLKTGSLVVVTPADDMFKEKTFVAVVAARPLPVLGSVQPQVDLLFYSHSVSDPAIEYVIAEERSAYFEATRHTMLAIQRMMNEP